MLLAAELSGGVDRVEVLPVGRHGHEEWVLDIGGPLQMEEFNRLPRDEKKQRLQAAVRRVEERLLAEETPEAQAEFRGLSSRAQKARLRSLLADYRLSLVPSFAGHFGRRMLDLEGALQAKVSELQEAIAHVKTLQGLLPICMHCKMIRDDSATWHRLETYIAKHSEANFTHSLCQSCLHEHYPQFAKTRAPQE